MFSCLEEEEQKATEHPPGGATQLAPIGSSATGTKSVSPWPDAAATQSEATPNCDVQDPVKRDSVLWIPLELLSALTLADAQKHSAELDKTLRQASKSFTRMGKLSEDDIKGVRPGFIAALAGSAESSKLMVIMGIAAAGMQGVGGSLPFVGTIMVGAGALLGALARQQQSKQNAAQALYEQVFELHSFLRMALHSFDPRASYAKQNQLMQNLPAILAIFAEVSNAASSDRDGQLWEEHTKQLKRVNTEVRLLLQMMIGQSVEETRMKVDGLLEHHTAADRMADARHEEIVSSMQVMMTMLSKREEALHAAEAASHQAREKREKEQKEQEERKAIEAEGRQQQDMYKNDARGRNDAWQQRTSTFSTPPRPHPSARGGHFVDSPSRSSKPGTPLQRTPAKAGTPLKRWHIDEDDIKCSAKTKAAGQVMERCIAEDEHIAHGSRSGVPPHNAAADDLMCGHCLTAWKKKYDIVD